MQTMVIFNGNAMHVDIAKLGIGIDDLPAAVTTTRRTGNLSLGAGKRTATSRNTAGTEIRNKAA